MLKLILWNSVLTKKKRRYLRYISVHTLRCFINKYLLSCDEAQKPGGEEAVVDDERHLSVYEPLCSKVPETSVSPFNMRIHQWFPLLHPCLVLTKGKQTANEDNQQSFPQCKQWGCILIQLHCKSNLLISRRRQPEAKSSSAFSLFSEKNDNLCAYLNFLTYTLQYLFTVKSQYLIS